MRKVLDLVSSPTDAAPTLGDVPPVPARRVHIDSYGCQMNLSDSEVIRAILDQAGYLAARVRRPTHRYNL